MTQRVRRPAAKAARLAGDANVFGALALAVADRVADRITTAAEQSKSGATALSSLYHVLDSPSVDRVRQVLGLTHSGTVRVLDELTEAGYVERHSADDARSRLVTLTARGRRVAQRVAQARADVLNATLEPLSEHERRVLAGLTARVLIGMKRGPGAVRWICRLCDTRACGRERGECPVAPHMERTNGRLDR